MCVPRNGGAYDHGESIVLEDEKAADETISYSGAHCMCTTHAQLLVSWAGRSLYKVKSA